MQARRISAVPPHAGFDTALGRRSRALRPLAGNAARAAGFTLLEMIVVLVIIGLIMGLVGPRLFGQADKAKVQTAETQIKMLRGGLQTMRLDISRWPTEQEGLSLLNTRPSGDTPNAASPCTSFSPPRDTQGCGWPRTPSGASDAST